ncbi:MAG: sigma-70 family RNA polymerase sigma factor [Leptospira sp.]|nr:sigma-70 family RNA polymerase sigma factor [Leptospira sp.]
MEGIYQNSHKKIYDFLYKYTNNEEVAADLMQETFLNYFKSYGETQLPPERTMMILYTIAKNNSINYSKKFSTVREKSGELDEFTSEKISFEKHAELNDMEQQLYKCIGRLSNDERLAVILKNVKGMNLTQIAEVMEISISTVSRLVVKGTARLVELAEKQGITPY